MFMGFKKWGAAVFCLLLGLALLGSYINRKVGQIAVQREQFGSQAAALRSLADLQKESEQAQSMLPKLDKILIKKEALAGFPDQLGNLAKKRAVILKASLGNQTAGTEIIPGALDFEIMATGTYAGIAAFLDDLKLSNFFIKFLSVGLINKGRNFEASIHGQVFFQ
jgi:hypothetical protein